MWGCQSCFCVIEALKYWIKVQNNWIKVPNNSIKVPNNQIKVPKNLIKAPKNCIIVPNNIIKVPNNFSKATNNINNLNQLLQLSTITLAAPLNLTLLQSELLSAVNCALNCHFCQSQLSQSNILLQLKINQQENYSHIVLIKCAL